MNTTISSAASYMTLTTSLAALVGFNNVTEPPRPSPRLPPRVFPRTPPLPERPTRPGPHFPTLPERPMPWHPPSIPGTARPSGSRQEGGQSGSTGGWHIGGGGGSVVDSPIDWGKGRKPLPTPPRTYPSAQAPNYKKRKTTTMSTTTTTVKETPTSSTPDHIMLYGAPLLLIIGTIGNALSGVVMMRKDLRKTTTSLFLTVLAIVDTAILYTGLLRQWLVIYKDIDIRKLSMATCKLHTFLLYAFNQYQAWLLVIVTIERLIAVFLPHHSKRLCTRPAAATSLAVTAVIIGGLNAHFFWTNQYIRIQFTNKDVAYCMPFDSKYANFVRNIWPWIDFIAFSMLPFVVLVSSNIAILLRMLYSHYLRRTSLHTHGNTVKMTSMTAILITVTFSFFVTTAPISIFLIMTDALREDASSVSTEEMRVTWVVFNLLTYTNNTFNFLLYCVSGSRFRRELINMFRRKNKIKPTSHSGTIEMPINNAVHSTTGQTLQTNVPQTSGFSATRTRSNVVVPPTRGQSSVTGGSVNGTHR